MMEIEVNQGNLFMLLPSKVAWMADYLTEDDGCSVVDAIRKIYSSRAYARLEDESTKWWHLGPVALYQLMTSSAD